MTNSKCAKYFLTDLDVPEARKKHDDSIYSGWAKRMAWLDDSIIKGAFHCGCSWYYKPSGSGLESHSHNFDQVVGFYGSDPKNPSDLGGELEIWLEDEKYVMNKSFLLFIPRGMKHGPTKTIKIDRPIFHFGASNSQEYTR
jgi:hypothetical protein